MSQEQRDQIKDLFAKYDADGNGSVSLSELKDIMKGITNMKDADVEKLFRTMDKNGNGSVEYDEFVNWVFGRTSKQDARAKAALIPSDASKLQLAFYNFCGPSTIEMDGRSFTKLCKDCKLVGKKFTATEADVVFAKVIVPGQRRISFEQFEKALGLVAEKSGAEVEELREAVAASGGPAFAGTQMENVRLHDDKSTYTGTHGTDGRHSIIVSEPSAGRRSSRLSIDSAAQARGRSPQPPPTPSRENVKQVFAEYDKNGDGTISLDELAPILKSVSGMKDADIEKMFRSMDKNGDGSLEIDEFVNWVFGRTSKQDARAKAALIPSDASKLQLAFYNFCGPSTIEMDGRSFTKLCKDCKLVGKKFTATDADVVFAKVIVPGQRRISFQQFENALEFIAEKSGSELAELRDVVAASGGPAFAGTQMENVRLHDDKSTYTGTHGTDGRHTVPSPSRHTAPRLSVDSALGASRSKSPQPGTPSTSASPSRSPSRSASRNSARVTTPPLSPSARGSGATMDMFKGFCGTAQDLDGKGFAKLCKDCGLLDKMFTPTDADILFAKVVTKGQRRINFEQFEDALVLAADKKNINIGELENQVRQSSGPNWNATQMENVRLHDDRSTYTGIHTTDGRHSM